MTRSEREARAGDPVEALVYECLERWPDEGREALERLCDEHPDHAAALCEGLARLEALGLVDPPWETRAAAHAGFPDRLDEFRLIRKIGGGGMGVVYLAEQESLARRVALKVIRPDRLHDPREVARFRREVEAVARLRHPGIVSVLSVGCDREIPYFAMEWLEGGTLHEVLRAVERREARDLTGQDLFEAVAGLAARDADVEPRGGEDASASASAASAAAAAAAAIERDGVPEAFRGTWCEAVSRIAREIADVLRHAHRHGIVHRDIKPSNVWITPEGRVVLIDFGLARSADASRLTRTGAQIGSLLYMSPEQIAGAAVDERTDVYALGVTFYELLTLRSPFESESSEIATRRIVEGEAPVPRSWNPAIPRDAQTVCLKAMSRDVGRRYADATAFSRDLSNVLGRRPIEARPPGRIFRARRWVERHPARASASVLLGASVLLAWFVAARERSTLRRVQLLADAYWIQTLTDEARSFWPPDPSRLEDIDRWLDEVGQVRERHDLHRRELRALRRRALPYSEEAAARDRAPVERKLDGLRGELRLVRRLVDRAEDREAAMAQNGVEIADLEALIAGLEGADPRTMWEFASREDEWRHERLTRLVEEDFRGLLELEAEVRDHRGRIENLVLGASGDAAEAWERAAADVARLPVYGGLRLRPQTGLRPLRRNPSSGLWEFLHVPSGRAPEEAPTPEDPGRLAVDAESGLVMVLLPGGAARIGARDRPGRDIDEDARSRSTEHPLHTVELAPFFLSKYEMTVGQYRCLGGALETGEEDSTLPISRSRPDMLGVLDRTWLRIPTEAQWEYACRAGTDTVFYTGDTPGSLEGHANLADRKRIGWPVVVLEPGQYTDLFDDGFEIAAPVGSFLPNPFGLYDVHGNVGEWVADVFITRAYRTMEARPGDGLRYFARDGLPGLRYGVRGGDFTSGPSDVRAARRLGVAGEIRWRKPTVRPSRAVHP